MHHRLGRCQHRRETRVGAFKQSNPVLPRLRGKEQLQAFAQVGATATPRDVGKLFFVGGDIEVTRPFHHDPSTLIG
jgi:hypothetical protein